MATQSSAIVFDAVAYLHDMRAAGAQYYLAPSGNPLDSSFDPESRDSISRYEGDADGLKLTAVCFKWAASQKANPRWKEELKEVLRSEMDEADAELQVEGGHSPAHLFKLWQQIDAVAKLGDMPADAMSNLCDSQSVLGDEIIGTPSQTQADFVAKLQFAIAITGNEDNIFPFETDLLESLAADCAHMRECELAAHAAADEPVVAA